MIYIKRTAVATDAAPMVLWENELLSATSVVATTEATDAPVENLLTDSTWDFWKPTSTTATVTATFPSSINITAIGIAAHNLGSLGATVNFKRGNTTIATITPTDDTPIIMLVSSTAYTIWRIEVTGSSAPVSIGSLFFGSPLVFESGIVPSYNPLWMAENIELLQNQSLGGQFFQNRVIRKSAEGSVQLNILDRSFVEGDAFQNFRNHYNDGKTFFWAAGPSVFDKDAAYVRRTSGGEMKPSFNDNGIFYNVNMQLEAYVG